MSTSRSARRSGSKVRAERGPGGGWMPRAQTAAPAPSSKMIATSVRRMAIDLSINRQSRCDRSVAPPAVVLIEQRAGPAPAQREGQARAHRQLEQQAPAHGGPTDQVVAGP